MGELPNFSGNNSFLDHDIKEEIVPEDVDLDFELPFKTTFPRQTVDNGASSSGSNLRSLFIGMGFLPSLVDRVLEEKGEDLGDRTVDLLLETLIEYSGQPRSKSESSDSLDRLFDDDDVTAPEVSKAQTKEENDFSNGVFDEKRASLRMMNFSANEIEFALSKLGENAEIDAMVDFIVAAQISERFKGPHRSTDSSGVKNEDTSDEALFGTMEKTLRLLEMGFTENEISSAFERFGAQVSIAELADSIFAVRYGEIDKDYRYSGSAMVEVKSEDFTGDGPSQLNLIRLEETLGGKRPKEEYLCDYSDSTPHPSRFDFRAIRKGKKPKQELFDDSSSCVRSTLGEEEAEDTKSTGLGMQRMFQPSPSNGINQVAAKPPFFFYGSVVNISQDWWGKISQFLYGREPEFVNTQFFSAISRKEGYVHNLPTGNRFHILPKPPMTIEEAIPHTKKWWPSWDTRKQLSCISSETAGLSLLCERLGRVLTDSRGLLSSEQQRDILHHCRTLNLLWVGPRKLGPIEPEYLEAILGYPMNHTQVGENNSSERLQTLKHCFQINTLGYHLSVLKSMFPEGLTMLSLFTGIGGAEVALHRLEIKLKAVVSVEDSETKRKILKRWWESSGQTGDLVQIEAVQRLTTNRLETLMKKFGGFDLVICQNPCIHSPNSKMAAEGDKFPGFDFSLFYEFVRVLQRVRSMMERKR
ncbi:probable inactive DNA (cytosine-5)-methyltransferase DRM3 [Punica granatum]|uniref:Probable inactive DNA (Cytosine-5)-methyltransferase DRM3 n=2 Tax=Punica granatum TaxID=22663 RepID=A0A6P8DS75_PUNGR|nr:probable inactive DNA (cytosine-5)-methyltransferase DRM3 [Punica granatum]